MIRAHLVNLMTGVPPLVQRQVRLPVRGVRCVLAAPPPRPGSATTAALTCRSPTAQLSEGLVIISAADFPAAWPTLLVELVAKLGPAVAAGDWVTAVGVLDTAARCGRRGRDRAVSLNACRSSHPLGGGRALQRVRASRAIPARR